MAGSRPEGEVLRAILDAPARLAVGSGFPRDWLDRLDKTPRVGAMKKLITVAVAATALLGTAPGSALAAQEPFAKVISHVKLKKDGTATVRARYLCESSTHLWVSAKQTADGSVDPVLEGEGSSSAAAAWMDTNDWVTVGEDTFPISSGDEQLVCDGRTHSQSVTIDVPNAPGGSWEALQAGMAWVQWCIVEEAENGEFISDQRWVTVK
jgi:hypothetical protein